ncbi:hypothetical protein [Campylobacter concisus]|uniref:hypothetical protein n=1 Tax=Campylobacter concisus TaxID=199 RepID=UPI000D3123D9|nr:hypothetical protein [Campylobacter concisus]
MKIEIGESLFYSWLRHVKECQIVQTNWKISPKWEIKFSDELENIMSKTDELFSSKYGYKIYKQNTSLKQLLQQAECDALGVCMSDGVSKIYAVDVAFHESGLNYGGLDETVARVVKKCLRTAMCVYGYFGVKKAEIIFASPKINRQILDALCPCFVDINNIMQEMGFEFDFRIIANSDFSNLVLEPILEVSGNVADTAELFMRSYQMLSLFDKKSLKDMENTEKQKLKVGIYSYQRSKDYVNIKNNQDEYAELKVGQIARIIMREILESGKVDANEISWLQNEKYSKDTLGLNYPALVIANNEYDARRYYVDPVFINGVYYKLCNDWYEGVTNDDRPLLIDWIRKFREK